MLSGGLRARERTTLQQQGTVKREDVKSSEAMLLGGCGGRPIPC